MILAWILPIVFLLALATPIIHRLSARHGGKLLAAGPLALFAWLLIETGGIVAGRELALVFEWVPSLSVAMALRMDGLALLFSLLITGIGAGVILYSAYYMEDDPELSRFQMLMLLFMGAMLGLVLADDLITLFGFWEMTSIVSFLLIGFKHSSEKARLGALKALLVTAGGGLALLLGFVLLGHAAETFRISEMLAGNTVRTHALYLPVLLLVSFGAFTKSAQLPFHFWLPDAMQAPTPASAFLHSATMVKAGVYLLARLHPVLGGTLSWQYLLGVIGLLTFLLGAYLAFKQNDLKALLAYSTISALGQLVALIGIGTTLAMKAAVVGILAHALYKSVLFLVVGMIDHQAGTRDLRELGGLRKAMPVTAAIALVGTLSMAGIPPFFGFLAKETLFEAGLEATLGTLPIWFVPAAVTTASIIAVGYSLLMFNGVFMGAAGRSPKTPHGEPWGMIIAPGLLAVLSLLLSFPPGRTEASALLGVAAGDALGSTVEVALQLWHGINQPLIASISAIIGGIVLYSARRLVREWQEQWTGPVRLDSAYDSAIVLLNQMATAVTRTFQSGTLRYYLIMILLTLVGLVSYALLSSGQPLALAWTTPDGPLYQWAVAGLMMVAALSVVAIPSRLGTVVALGTVGYLMALVFVLFSGPDLALTQLLVETLTVILLLVVFYFLPRFFEDRTSRLARLRDTLLAGSVGLLMTILVGLVVPINLSDPISEYYMENSLPLGHGANVVNVILVDFRALDTLGELTVLIVAGISIIGLIKLRPQPTGEEYSAPEEPPGGPLPADSPFEDELVSQLEKVT